MRIWNYDNNIEGFVELLNEICNDGNEFDLIVPKKFNAIFEILQKYNNEINNLYNIVFIDDDIDYIIIEDLDVIKIINYDERNNEDYVTFKHWTVFNTGVIVSEITIFKKDVKLCQEFVNYPIGSTFISTFTGLTFIRDLIDFFNKNNINYYIKRYKENK